MDEKRLPHEEVGPDEGQEKGRIQEPAEEGQNQHQANGLKRRGRPKGSKNKPKEPEVKRKKRFIRCAPGDVDVFWRRG